MKFCRDINLAQVETSRKLNRRSSLMQKLLKLKGMWMKEDAYAFTQAPSSPEQEY